MKKRKDYIDIARGIAIILVVMSHCDNFKLWSIGKFVNLFFMPLFFWISGFFFKMEAQNFGELVCVIKKKCAPIYLYYLKFELFYLILRNFFINNGLYNQSVLDKNNDLVVVNSVKIALLNVLKIVLLAGREPFCGAFWFLVSLIFIIIMYSTIIFISKKIIIHSEVFVNFSVLLLFVIGCIMRYTVSIPRISPAITMILFYHCGRLSNKHGIKFNSKKLFIFSILSLNILYFLGSVSINSNYFSNPVFLLTSSFLGIYMVIFISKKIESKLNYMKRMLAYIGRHTLPIVAMHFISFKVIMLVQYYFGNITYNQLGNLTGANNNNILYLFYVLSGITVPLAIEYLCNLFKKINLKLL
jgi:fucose 4-O-acetylase-like acetyltransferase